MRTTTIQAFINPNPHCLGIKKASYVKMKRSPGWLKQNIFLKIKNASQKILNFFVSEVFKRKHPPSPHRAVQRVG
jgi:hypothetical protein